jgi:hypothetical protein
VFINELMSCLDLFARIKAWHAANKDAIELADQIHAGQIHGGVVHALEATSVEMQLTAQEIDGR